MTKETIAKSDRILILGNGPSAKQGYFPLFRGIATLGMNAAYRYWDKISWYPNIYCCLDNEVVLSHADAIIRLIRERKCEKFFLAADILDLHPWLAGIETIMFLPQMQPGKINAERCAARGLVHTPNEFFSTSAPSKLTTGSYSVRFAAALGYQEIGLIGIDCRYVEIVEGAKRTDGIALEIEKTPGKNPNYFFDDYQRAGDRYNLPNPSSHSGNLHLQAFVAMKTDFERKGFAPRIRNCAKESELFEKKVFPFVPVEHFARGKGLSAIFVPFVRKDLEQLKSKLAMWGGEFVPYDKPKTTPTAELHFAYNGFRSEEIEQELERAYYDSRLDRFFSQLKFHYSELEGLRDLYTRDFHGPVGPEGYMAGPNNQFFDIVRRFSFDMSHIHIVEADVTPLKSGWLSRIEEIIDGSDCLWICGSHYRGSGLVKALWHINGNAIYNVGDANFRDFFEKVFLPHFYERQKKTPSLCYDIVLHDLLATPIAQAHDEKAAALWKECAHRIRFSEHIVDLSHPDDFLPENILSRQQILQKFPEAVLVHGAIRDGQSSSVAEHVRATLNHRTTDQKAIVVAVDPDAIDEFGHYLAYDKRLAEACEELHNDFAVIGRIDLKTDLLPPTVKTATVLSVHTWKMAYRPDGSASPEREKFVEELRRGLCCYFADPAQPVKLYMYCGSLEHAVAIQEAIEAFSHISATVNLFWQSFISPPSIRFTNRWRPHVWALTDDPRITLTVPTKGVQDDVERQFGVFLPIAPHPSPSISDKDARLLVKDSRRQPSTPLSVLFPGGTTKGKGFDLTVQAARALSKTALRPIVRIQQRPNQEDLAPVVDTLLADGVRIVEGYLDEIEFRGFLESGDIIVCPYLPSHFRNRTSGLVVDAILLGRPVVAVRGTWLAEHIASSGAGVIADATDASIVSAIEQIADGYEQYAQAACEARSDYMERNSWRALVHSVVAEPADRGTDVASAGHPLADRDAAIARLPVYLRSSIFLPTDRVPLAQQIEGLKRVQRLYESQLDEVYRTRMRDLKVSRRRRRCFVIGNGPSLKETDLKKLANEVTFATNGFFLKLPELNWRPTFYVVEDHLVAEDRAREINRLRGPVKFFPASLAYAIKADSDTIFFDHRPRKSFPDGFDFSFDADDHTFAGGTVTFTCLQLAAYLGFEEIYLVGVDASYAIPGDAKMSGMGRVKELDMTSDDPNHFHPDYFGKGKRWHEPNVDVMIAAYEEARRACDGRGVKIYNATIGGKLEVFPRVDFESLFETAPDAPRLLIIDHTKIGNGTATGEVKSSLFANWPPARLLQFFEVGGGSLGFHQDGSDQSFLSQSRSVHEHIKKRLDAFGPEIILYRPVPDTPSLHKWAMNIIQYLDLPVAVWVMDDWPKSLEENNPRLFKKLDADFRALLERSRLNLSISEAMSEAFSARYGKTFKAFANGVDPDEWPKAALKRPQGPVKVRYAGSLAENMTLETVRLVAGAVETLAREGVDIIFEIKTRELWRQIAAPLFERVAHTHFVIAELPRTEYNSWLSDADIVLIGYNFDETSKNYMRYSLANKLPECLASGSALLAVGPSDVATMQMLQKFDCGVRVTEDDADEVAAALRALASSPKRRFSLAQKAQSVAFKHFDIRSTRSKFMRALAEIAASPHADLTDIPRVLHAHVDETAAIARLLEARRGREHIMLDVGAHVGSSAAYFDKLGWTIHCFEPDPSNRKKLLTRFGAAENVTIDARAVSDRPASSVSFFSSNESSGISGLHAFHDTHHESARVDVTTVAEIVADRDIDRIDFLKIDVEGFDFAVLKGAPWSKLKPDVIECEFEDAKTLPLGHSWRDISAFLREKGYAVYVSEWHPIVRYGIRHDWRRLVPLDGAEIPADAWGNLLAFKEDPGLAALRNAFADVMKPLSPNSPRASASRQKSLMSNASVFDALAAPLLAQRFYGPLADILKVRSPQLFTILRFVKKTLGSLWRRRMAVIPGIVVFAAWIAVGFIPDFAPWRALVWGAAAFTFLSAALSFLALRIRQFTEALTKENVMLRRAINSVQKTAVENANQTKILRKAAATTASEAAWLRGKTQTLGESVDRLMKDNSAHEVRMQKLHRQLADVEKKNGAEIEAIRLRAEATDKNAVFNNAIWYQRFNRRLSRGHLDTLLNIWAVDLPHPLTAPMIGYMAHRACLVEALMHGRLAGSLEDVLLRTLVAMRVESRDIDILEIGTLFGVAAGIMYDALAPRFANVHMSLIDPLDGYYEPEKLDVLTGQPICESILRRNLSIIGVDDEYLTLIKHLSTDEKALELSRKRQYDVLVIDGDHTYEGVKSDFNLYSPMMKPGGFIVFDDYGSEKWPDVKRFVDEEIEGRDDFERLGATWRTCVYRVVKTAT